MGRRFSVLSAKIDRVAAGREGREREREREREGGGEADIASSLRPRSVEREEKEEEEKKSSRSHTRASVWTRYLFASKFLLAQTSCKHNVAIPHLPNGL